MSDASGFAAGFVFGKLLSQNQFNADRFEKGFEVGFVNRPAYCLPPGFDPPDTFEKHEAAYKRLKAAGMLPPELEPKPKKSFWEWLFG